MKKHLTLVILASTLFIWSFFLPAYDDETGFSCLQSCLDVLNGGNLMSAMTGGWRVYYSLFVLSNLIFPILVITLFTDIKFTLVKITLAIAALFHVLSWLALHMLSHDLLHIRFRYYILLISYSLLF